MGSDFPIETPAHDNPFAQGQALSAAPITDTGLPLVPEAGHDGARYYTIQRVNGNGANGKGDGTAGAHKHSIEESDRVKKSSLHRHFLKEEKERRKSMVGIQSFPFQSNKKASCTNHRQPRLQGGKIPGRASS